MRLRVDGGAHRAGTRSITLDKRNLKTPSGLPLRLPPQKLAAALMIAHEWDVQDVVLKPHNLPVVRDLLWMISVRSAVNDRLLYSVRRA